MSYTAQAQATAGRDFRFMTTVFDDGSDLQASFAVYPATLDPRALREVLRELPWAETKWFEAPLSEHVVIDTLASVIADTRGRDVDESLRAFAAYLAREPLIAIRRSPVSVESLMELVQRLGNQGTYGAALVVGTLSYYADDPLWILCFAGAIVVMSAARRAGEAIDNLDALLRPPLGAGTGGCRDRDPRT
jgi:hypothetical protein